MVQMIASIALVYPQTAKARHQFTEKARMSANDHGADHPGMNGAVISKRSSRLERTREVIAGRDDSRVPARGVGRRRVGHGIGVRPRHGRAGVDDQIVGREGRRAQN